MSDDDEPEPSGLDGLPPMFAIAQGEVVSVQTYGAFVRLPGYKKEGWLSADNKYINWLINKIQASVQYETTDS